MNKKQRPSLIPSLLWAPVGWLWKKAEKDTETILSRLAVGFNSIIVVSLVGQLWKRAEQDTETIPSWLILTPSLL